MKRVGTVLALAALLLSACGHAAPRGEGTLRAQGDVRLTGTPGPVAIGRNVRIRPGDRVVVRSGTARISLPGGGRLDLREGSSVRFQSGPALEAGALLVQSGPRPVRVDTGIGDIVVDGAGRVRRDLALDVGTYRGKVTVTSGRTLTVAWLREVAVPSVGVAPDPTPLRVTATDSWDTQFLGQAVDLTAELDSRTSYVNANSPAGTDHAAFYIHALRPLASTASFDDGLLRSASPAGPPLPGEAIVTASIALSGPGPFAERWRTILDLRAQGAQWGIVVLDQHADPSAVLGLLDGAVNASAVTPTVAVLALAKPGVDASPSVPAAPVEPHPTTPAAVTSTTSPTRPTQPVHPKPTTAPSTTLLGPLPIVPPAQPPPPALAPIVDPVVAIMRSLGLPPR